MQTLLTKTQASITCTYENQGSKFQIVRIENLPNQYFERTVFPGQRILIETSVQAILNVYAGPMMSSLLEARIPCSQLQMAH